MVSKVSFAGFIPPQIHNGSIVAPEKIKERITELEKDKTPTGKSRLGRYLLDTSSGKSSQAHDGINILAKSESADDRYLVGMTRVQGLFGRKVCIDEGIQHLRQAAAKGHRRAMIVLAYYHWKRGEEYACDKFADLMRSETQFLSPELKAQGLQLLKEASKAGLPQAVAMLDFLEGRIGLKEVLKKSHFEYDSAYKLDLKEAKECIEKSKSGLPKLLTWMRLNPVFATAIVVGFAGLAGLAVFAFAIAGSVLLGVIVASTIILYSFLQLLQFHLEDTGCLG